MPHEIHLIPFLKIYNIFGMEGGYFLSISKLTVNLVKNWIILLSIGSSKTAVISGTVIKSMKNSV